MMEFEDLPDPEAVELDAARAVLLGVVERATEDASLAFAKPIIAACALLRDEATAEYISLEQRLRAIANFPWGEFRAAMRAIGKRTVSDAGTAPAKSWHNLLTFNNGKPESTEANCITALVHAPQWKGVLAFNEFANNVITRKPPPWFRDDAPAGGAKAGEWDDGDDVRLVCWFQREIGLKVSVAIALNALATVAHRNKVHPVREYLEGLAWDGTVRLPTWLAKYAGATQPAAYLERVGTWFLISAVARAYKPGCEAHHCIILEGAQGAGKSTLVKRLVPQGEWFAEHNANLMDKDAYAILNGRWIMELAELDSLARAEVGRIKRYMTTSTDSYRPVWARRVARFPRHGVFIGTVNDSEYLRDPTGNRRFWPVSVGEIDNQGLEENRDQLWAEAKHWFLEGVNWWPPQSDILLLKKEQDERYRSDAWEEPIARWLDEKIAEEMSRPASMREEVFVTPSEILKLAIQKLTKDHEDKDVARVGRVMTRLQWQRKQRRGVGGDSDVRDNAGGRVKTWGYIPPETPAPTPSGGYGTGDTSFEPVTEDV